MEQKKYCCVLAREAQLEALFALYVQRIAWMDAQGICQWNKTNYLGRYPLAYYAKHQRMGRLYVLQEAVSGAIAGAMVLLERDPRWPDEDQGSAYYVHNLVTALAAPGAGRQLLREAEHIAQTHGKALVRLDCAVDNAPLNRYYEAQGYVPAGTCVDGPYAGILREKRV